MQASQLEIAGSKLDDESTDDRAEDRTVERTATGLGEDRLEWLLEAAAVGSCRYESFELKD